MGGSWGLRSNVKSVDVCCELIANVTGGERQDKDREKGRGYFEKKCTIQRLKPRVVLGGRVCVAVEKL